MQSNVAVKCRALLMVACAIAIPAVAIFGKSLPDSLWDVCCHCLAASGSTALPKPAEPRSPSPATPNPTPELTGLELPKSASWPELNQAHGDAANADRQVSAAPSSGGPRPDGNLPSLEEVASRRPGDAMSQMPAAASAEDQFKSIQQRLRQLGARGCAQAIAPHQGRGIEPQARKDVAFEQPGLIDRHRQVLSIP